MKSDFDLKSKQLDELMLETNGLSLDELIKCAFQRGILVGYKVGKTDGRRAAKGLKDNPRRRGPPSKMDEGLRALMLYEVRKMQAEGATVERSIQDFLEIWRLGQKRLGISQRLPTVKEALAMYFRDKANMPSRSIASKKSDDALKAYVRELVKQGRL